MNAMYVLNLKFNNDEIIDIIKHGIPAYSWSKLLGRAEIGNFYKSFQLLPDNLKSQDPLYFRSCYIGNQLSDDKLGPVYQASHYHIGLFQHSANEAGDYVSGFQINSTYSMLEHFGQLQGLQGMSPLGNRIIFSETPQFKTESTNGKTEEIDPVYPKTDSFPGQVPIEFMSLIKAGHCLYWNAITMKFYPVSIHPLFQTKTYFNIINDPHQTRYRALYILEPLFPLRDDDSTYGKYFIIGFGVSYKSQNRLRGFGSIEYFQADAVQFEQFPIQ